MRRIEKWVQAITAIGLIAGIVLVIIQLQQNEELLRFQIAADLRFNRDSDRFSTRGEEYSTTLAKLQTSPEQMTDAELIQFSMHARSLVDELSLRRMLAREGVFIGDWRGWLWLESCELFNNPLGRTWLKAHEEFVDEELIEEFGRRIEECGELPSFIEAVRKDRSQGG